MNGSIIFFRTLLTGFFRFGFPAYLLLFLLFAALPSVVMPELMQPTQTGKFFAFVYALLAVIILFWFHTLFSNKPINVRITLLDILLGLLFLYITINRYFLQEIWGFSLMYYELMGLGALYILLRQMDRNIYPWLMLAVILSGIVQAVYGNLQLYGYFPSHHNSFRMTGSFFNPGPYSGFLSVVFPIALGIYLFKPFDKYCSQTKETSLVRKLPPASLKYIFKYISLIALITIFLVLPASLSRAAWLAAGLSTAFLLFVRYKGWEYLRRMLNSPMKRVAVGIIAFSLLAGGCWGLYHFKKGSADGRLLVWKVTGQMIADQPFMGNGFDRFKAEYMNYQADYFQGNPESEEAMVAGDIYYAFNEPIQFTAENGMIGALFLIAVLMIILKAKDEKEDRLLLVAKAGLLSVFIFSLFSYPSQILPVKITVVLLLAVVAGHGKQVIIDISKKRLKFPGLTIKSILISGILAGVFYVAIEIEKIYKGFQDWQNAFSLYQIGAYTASLEDYKKAEIIFHNEGDFLMNYGKALSMDGEHERAAKVLKEAENHLNTTIIQAALGDSFKSLKEYKDAEDAYWHAWHMIPSRFYPKYLLAKLYDETGNDQRAVEIAQELMIKEVKVESTAIEEIKAEMEIIVNKNSD